MNLYKFYNQPETLSGDEKIVIPQLFFSEMMPNVKDKSYETIVNDPAIAITYAEWIGSRFPDGEDAIATRAPFSIEYARDIIGKRFRKGEKKILETPSDTFSYVKDVIKGEWPEGEKTLAKDYEYAFKYAELNGKRFKAGEKVIGEHPKNAYFYALNMIGGRFPEGEDAIKTVPAYYDMYKKYLRERKGIEI